MGQVAFTIDQQITLLTERGLNFEGYNTEKIKEVLGDIGYYRLGFYWFDFYDFANEKFKPDTKFATIVDLYYLDHDIRYTLIKYLHRIEVNFRTQLIYFASNKYRSNNAWFSDKKVMSQAFVDELPNYYNEKFKSDYSIICKHHNKYDCDYAPAWKTLEHFPFGAVFKIYTNLLDSDLKQRISLKYDLRNTHKFENIMQKIVHIRNRCSHGALLYNYNLTKSCAKIPQIDLPINDNYQSLNAIIKYTAFILKSISSNRYNDLNTDILLILNKARAQNVDSYTIFCTKAGISYS